jgi:hypothetical protein
VNANYRFVHYSAKPGMARGQELEMVPPAGLHGLGYLIVLLMHSLREGNKKRRAEDQANPRIPV